MMVLGCVCRLDCESFWQGTQLGAVGRSLRCTEIIPFSDRLLFVCGRTVTTQLLQVHVLVAVPDLRRRLGRPPLPSFIAEKTLFSQIFLLQVRQEIP